MGRQVSGPGAAREPLQKGWSGREPPPEVGSPLQRGGGWPACGSRPRPGRLETAQLAVGRRPARSRTEMTLGSLRSRGAIGLGAGRGGDRGEETGGRFGGVTASGDTGWGARTRLGGEPTHPGQALHQRGRALASPASPLLWPRPPAACHPPHPTPTSPAPLWPNQTPQPHPLLRPGPPPAATPARMWPSASPDRRAPPVSQPVDRECLENHLHTQTLTHAAAHRAPRQGLFLLGPVGPVSAGAGPVPLGPHVTAEEPEPREARSRTRSPPSTHADQCLSPRPGPPAPGPAPCPAYEWHQSHWDRGGMALSGAATAWSVGTPHPRPFHPSRARAGGLWRC